MARRYTNVSLAKSSGATYTPVELADFVARQMLDEFFGQSGKRKAAPTSLRILDPAVGDGQLLASLLGQLGQLPRGVRAHVVGYDCDPDAVSAAQSRLIESGEFSRHKIEIVQADFLALKAREKAREFDLVIANPPYVRTQVMGAAAARALADKFGLTGRIDLYHAFILAIAQSLSGDGVAGLIVSNRFMTTKSGRAVRQAIANDLQMRHVWDFGDTRLFDAAVLPAVLVAAGRESRTRRKTRFSSIYSVLETDTAPSRKAKAVASVIQALEKTGVVKVPDGREFQVLHGRLEKGCDKKGGDETGVWRLATREGDRWLKTVGEHTDMRFGDLGAIRVGVKTCADRVFIRDDWDSLPASQRPELLKPLTTHHMARPYRADRGQSARKIVYPHLAVRGKRKVADLDDYPHTKSYLRKHAAALRARNYVQRAGREWYEVWVPQDPAAWKKTKLVFRDIAAQPCFWIDKSGSVVNGDCYWLVCNEGQPEDRLWLAAAVGNSTFIETFYDHRFNNRLYAGRRRFLTQYVEQFPLPDSSSRIAKQLVTRAKEVYRRPKHASTESRIRKLDSLVWKAFGLVANDGVPKG